MRILFIVNDIYTDHIGIMLLSSILKQNGHSVEVVEASYKKIVKKLKNYRYDILAYSCPTILSDYYISLNKLIRRNFDIFSVFGGAHPTFVPEMIEEEGIDCICRGEGEFAFLELAEKLKFKKPIRKIKNLWVKDNGNIFKNPLRELVKNLDDLPFPDRDLFPFSEAIFKRKMHVITSRGCPYSCSYCSQSAYDFLYNSHAAKVRRRSVGNVIKEIQQITKKVSLRLIMFEDDLFISSIRWINSFCKEYQNKINIPFFCYTRADTINPDIVSKLRRAGCVSISMGLESANDYLRENVLRRHMSRDNIIEAARIIKKEKIRLETTNIIGIPGSSLKDDLETLKMNVKCNVDYSSVKLLMPYPKTKIRKFAASMGCLIDKYPSSEWKSSIRFHTDRDKRARENLRKFFAITVEFPFLLPVVKKIIYFPLGYIYMCVYIVWDGYTAFFRLYPTGFRGFIWGIRKFIGAFHRRIDVLLS
ncbi:MAG: B12-binding domain-containing radical SAM protein [Candidatus Omnitrophica bacterium]|nr:B12-binding domain-containing radical SAM protein [Candidatus Omnitrophota bacterium]MCF7891954.1 B12-binding domain-containing radical SAM protein [Candidatus Omnitrophota bacterium]MCF7895484.1 B12-binding domain-containing radical SAM protein [Candidatus Omnitrophota bacterium]MCF7898003.1 B12-binding domain-containing radical SAM protein [Candidatus Omnitrophota bacterium]MCF7909643.1 B12-binding domain-containing radical SAM protein [Candidatus Omnitrophota bacterium]